MITAAHQVGVEEQPRRDEHAGQRADSAARPQPIISIRPTGMPTSRLAAGFTAAARMASPSFVCWKNSDSTPTTPSRIADQPDRLDVDARRRRGHRCRPRNRLGKPRFVEAPDPARRC